MLALRRNWRSRRSCKSIFIDVFLTRDSPLTRPLADVKLDLAERTWGTFQLSRLHSADTNTLVFESTKPVIPPGRMAIEVQPSYKHSQQSGWESLWIL